MKIHSNPHKALQHCEASGDDHAVSIGGRVYSLTEGEFRECEEGGVQPTTWHDRNGQIISVPGRDG